MPVGKSFNLKPGQYVPSQTKWGASFPNPADISFDYRKMLESCIDDLGIARNSDGNETVAIVGAGIAGLTAARELARSGFTKIKIFEAGPLIGGRHDTLRGTASGQYTCYEGGAMRFPPFLKSSTGDRTDGTSLFSYYFDAFSLSGEGFPNPGSQFATTGIYYNEGWHPGASRREMLVWDKSSSEPPIAELKTVYEKWQTFANSIIDVVCQKYVTDEWPNFWKAIVTNYWRKTFRDAVLDPIKAYSDSDPGNWGGAGMTEEEANLFYLIGGGDGSWGAFYNLSFLYAYRTFVHGFGADLFLLHGRFDSSGGFDPGPNQGVSSLRDGWGLPLPAPRYLGARSIDECMLFMPIDKIQTSSGREYTNISLYDLTQIRDDPDVEVSLFMNTKITAVDESGSSYKGVEKLELTGLDPRDQSSFSYTANHVIFTVPTWQFGTEIDVRFNKASQEKADVKWPFEMQAYFSRAHWEPACKVFVTLTSAYWEEEGNRIPQVFTSDTFIHDAYAYKASVSDPSPTAVLLVSYTWWRDATKLISYDVSSFNDGTLVDMCLNELERICRDSANINQSILQYVDRNEPFYVIQWERQPNFKGAARLYDQREWMDTQYPMAYNQEKSSVSHIYFAGEAYSVDAGWTEPALRGAIDAVLHIARNSGAPLNVEDFSFDDDYPRYDVDWRPSAR